VERPVDVGLVAAAALGAALEPGDHVGVEAQRQLPLQRPVEEAALRPGPVADLGDVGRIDAVVGERRQRLDLAATRPLAAGTPSTLLSLKQMVSHRIPIPQGNWELQRALRSVFFLFRSRFGIQEAKGPEVVPSTV